MVLSASDAVGYDDCDDDAKDQGRRVIDHRADRQVYKKWEQMVQPVYSERIKFVRNHIRQAGE